MPDKVYRAHVRARIFRFVLMKALLFIKRAISSKINPSAVILLRLQSWLPPIHWPQARRFSKIIEISFRKLALEDNETCSKFELMIVVTQCEPPQLDTTQINSPHFCDFVNRFAFVCFYCIDLFMGDLIVSNQTIFQPLFLFQVFAESSRRTDSPRKHHPTQNLF